MLQSTKTTNFTHNNLLMKTMKITLRLIDSTKQVRYLPDNRYLFLFSLKASEERVYQRIADAAV